jgi:hypothetical protein
MKTLADFKRAMKVGTRWSGYNHLYKSNMGVREVSKVKSTSFAFRMQKDDGSFVDSWCDFPKAPNIEFMDDGTVNIYAETNYYFGSEHNTERKLLLSYKQV